MPDSTYTKEVPVWLILRKDQLSIIGRPQSGSFVIWESLIDSSPGCYHSRFFHSLLWGCHGLAGLQLRPMLMPYFYPRTVYKKSGPSSPGLEKPRYFRIWQRKCIWWERRKRFRQMKFFQFPGRVKPPMIRAYSIYRRLRKHGLSFAYDHACWPCLTR